MLSMQKPLSINFRNFRIFRPCFFLIVDVNMYKRFVSGHEERDMEAYWCLSVHLLLISWYGWAENWLVSSPSSAGKKFRTGNWVEPIPLEILTEEMDSRNFLQFHFQRRIMKMKTTTFGLISTQVSSLESA